MSLMDGKKGEAMKGSIKTLKAILAMVIVVVMLSVSNWAFGQGGSISGCITDLSNNQGRRGDIITAKGVSAGVLAGTGNTDAGDI